EICVRGDRGHGGNECKRRGEARRGGHQAHQQGRREPAECDAGEDDAEHYGKRQRAAFDEEEKEPKPDDLEREQAESSEKRGKQIWSRSTVTSRLNPLSRPITVLRLPDRQQARHRRRE